MGSAGQPRPPEGRASRNLASGGPPGVGRDCRPGPSQPTGYGRDCHSQRPHESRAPEGGCVPDPRAAAAGQAAGRVLAPIGPSRPGPLRTGIQSPAERARLPGHEDLPKSSRRCLKRWCQAFASGRDPRPHCRDPRLSGSQSTPGSGSARDSARGVRRPRPGSGSGSEPGIPWVPAARSAVPGPGKGKRQKTQGNR